MKRAVLFLVISLSAAFAAFPFTTVLLIDTSRSVPPGEFSAAKARLAALAPDLVKAGGVTVVSFNDEPVFEGTSLQDASSVAAKIEGVGQGGRYTLLYDAVFKALQSLEDSRESGAIILVSDGKDENSAVVLEDAAKKAEALKVPVLTIGIGAEEKSLRRLSALTKGEYMGNVAAFAPGAVAGLVSDARSKRLAEAAQEKPAPRPAEPVPAPPPQAAEKGSSTTLILLVVALCVAAFAAAAIAIAFMVKNRKEKEKTCEKCGRNLSLWESECPDCFIKEISDTKPGLLSPESREAPAPDLDPELFKKEPTAADLDSTMIIEEIPILLQMRGNQPPRMYQVSKDKATSVGRDKVNGIFIDDRTLSGQHFRIAPKDGTWFVLDLDSTNGTFVDGERIKFKEIKPGSQIHAGQCQFIFRIEQKRLS